MLTKITHLILSVLFVSVILMDFGRHRISRGDDFYASTKTSDETTTSASAIKKDQQPLMIFSLGKKSTFIPASDFQAADGDIA